MASAAAHTSLNSTACCSPLALLEMLLVPRILLPARREGEKKEASWYLRSERVGGEGVEWGVEEEEGGK